jgi:hypothetical protein
VLVAAAGVVAYRGGMTDLPPAVTERRLTIVADEMQAEMVRSLLEQHGIACVVRRAALGEVQWGAINVGMGGPREIIVGEEDLEAARALLAEDHGTGSQDEPSSAADAPDLVERSRRLNDWWVLAIMVLFGIPLVIGLFALLGGILQRM